VSSDVLTAMYSRTQVLLDTTVRRYLCCSLCSFKTSHPRRTESSKHAIL